MPEECASMRSIARCVLPVLVGPSTAVTPEPGARSAWNVDEGEKAINSRSAVVAGSLAHPEAKMGSAAGFCECAKCLKLCHIATPCVWEFKLGNESRTKR